MPYPQIMKHPAVSALGCLVAFSVALRAAPDPNWLDHDRERPQATVIDPGTLSTQEQPGRPPSDATVLFDGKDLSQWAGMDGSTAKWVIQDGLMVCVPGTGNIRTLQSFGDCQLHVEWATPTPPHGNSQQRGNSGVFFGYDRYELQVLDSYQNSTYADGAAAAVYGQYPPLVNAMLPPGKWEIYDIIWTAPRFDSEGNLVSRARETVFHNGVLVQNNVELTGPTAAWIDRLPYKAHPERLPISLQDHNAAVKYRNVWIRELGNPRHKEFMLPDALLESYVGDYATGSHRGATVRRLPDGLLSLTFSGTDTVMHAESLTKFYATAVDVRCEFNFTGTSKELGITVGDNDEVFKMERVTP
jgi:hypothetical protein